MRESYAKYLAHASYLGDRIVMQDSQYTRAANNSLKAHQELLANVDRLHEVPPGEKPLKGNDLALWRFLMRAKPYKDWSSTDLILAYKYIQYDRVIKKGEDRIDQFIEDGTDILEPDTLANDYYKELDKVRQKQISVLRSLGLTHAALRQQPNNNNRDKQAQDENETEDAIQFISKHGTGRLPAFMAKQ